MTATLIVLAHPERRSFNGAWADATASACRALGHAVSWSDLYALDFHPAEGPRHYQDRDSAARFDPLKAQEAAAEQDTLPEAVRQEVDKIRQADRIVFHFPMWWFAPPAMLKGWFDRVLAHGALHDVAHRFDRGLCRGKQALFCVTTGSDAQESAWNGKEGDVQMLLWPSAYALRYLGFDVLRPVLAHGVHGYHTGVARTELESRLSEILADQARIMREFDAHPRLRFNADTEFDADGRLKPEAPSHSRFIRHDP